MNRPPLEIENLVSDHERLPPATDAQADLPPPSYHDDIHDLSDVEALLAELRAVEPNPEGSKP